MSRPALLLLFTLTSCRSFPIGLYVPASVLDALEHSSYVEDLDEGELAVELARRAGVALHPSETSARAYYRLDTPAVLGPLAPDALDAAHPATADLVAGDILLVKNPRAQSLATTLSFDEFTYYNHLGVLIEREGLFFVCDCWPSFHPLVKARDFADRFRGGVRAQPLGAFVAHYESVLFARLTDPAARARLARETERALEEELEYDPHHDPTDPRLSCSEFVALLFERAGIEGLQRPRPVSARAEMRAYLTELGFTNAGFLVPDQLLALPQVRTAAWFSRHPSRPRARADEAAFAVLLERFRSGDRLGDFLGIARLHFLRYRANVAAFLRWASAWAEARGLADQARLRAELGALQDLFFRPLGGPQRRSSGSQRSSTSRSPARTPAACAGP